jgi:hypothetical protein
MRRASQQKVTRPALPLFAGRIVLEKNKSPYARSWAQHPFSKWYSFTSA